MVAARRDAPRAFVYFFGGCVFRAGYGEIAREGNRAQRDRETDYFARRGDFWNGLAVSRAGICPRLSLVTVDGFTAGRRAKHPWAFHDADGRPVLGHWRGQRRRGEDAYPDGRNFWGGDCGDGDTAALDDARAEVSSLAHRVLYHRRPRLQGAAAVALSVVSLVGVRFCWTRSWFFSLFRFCQAQRRAGVCTPERHGNRCLLLVCFV